MLTLFEKMSPVVSHRAVGLSVFFACVLICDGSIIDFLLHKHEGDQDQNSAVIEFPSLDEMTSSERVENRQRARKVATIIEQNVHMLANDILQMWSITTADNEEDNDADLEADGDMMAKGEAEPPEKTDIESKQVLESHEDSGQGANKISLMDPKEGGSADILGSKAEASESDAVEKIGSSVTNIEKSDTDAEKTLLEKYESKAIVKSENEFKESGIETTEGTGALSSDGGEKGAVSTEYKSSAEIGEQQIEKDENEKQAIEETEGSNSKVEESRTNGAKDAKENPKEETDEQRIDEDRALTNENSEKNMPEVPTIEETGEKILGKEVRGIDAVREPQRQTSANEPLVEGSKTFTFTSSEAAFKQTNEGTGEYIQEGKTVENDTFDNTKPQISEKIGSQELNVVAEPTLTEVKVVDKVEDKGTRKSDEMEALDTKEKGEMDDNESKEITESTGYKTAADAPINNESKAQNAISTNRENVPKIETKTGTIVDYTPIVARAQNSEGTESQGKDLAGIQELVQGGMASETMESTVKEVQHSVEVVLQNGQENILLTSEEISNNNNLDPL